MKRRLSDSIFALSVSECRLTASNSLPPVAASMISFFWRSTFSCRFRSKASMLLSDSARVTRGSFSFSNGLGSIATTELDATFGAEPALCADLAESGLASRRVVVPVELPASAAEDEPAVPNLLDCVDDYLPNMRMV